MPSIVIRSLNDEAYSALEKRARAHGRTVEEEAGAELGAIAGRSSRAFEGETFAQSSWLLRAQTKGMTDEEAAIFEKAISESKAE